MNHSPPVGVTTVTDNKREYTLYTKIGVLIITIRHSGAVARQCQDNLAIFFDFKSSSSTPTEFFFNNINTTRLDTQRSKLNLAR